MSKRKLASEAPKESLPLVKPKKAYRNDAFLNSGHARHIRILCEYEETMQRLRAEKVKATIMFFGSARSKFSAEHAAALAAARESGNAVDEMKLSSSAWMCDYMDKIKELSRRCTEWAVARSSQAPLNLVSGVARTTRVRRSNSAIDVAAYLPHSTDDAPGTPGASAETAMAQTIVVCTGGGPGFMEAANRGAAEVEGGRSIGMGITLPFEAGLNPYVSEELAFEFHYFFTRKFWMAFHMQALVVAPGGFGTCDELFELLTLKQTGKIQKQLPIVLFGKAYWKDVINWEALAKYGVCSPKDVEELLFTDDVEEAFQFITSGLEFVLSAASFSADYGE